MYYTFHVPKSQNYEEVSLVLSGHVPRKDELVVLDQITYVIDKVVTYADRSGQTSTVVFGKYAIPSELATKNWMEFAMTRKRSR